MKSSSLSPIITRFAFAVLFFSLSPTVTADILPPADFKSSVADVIASDRGDFAGCLRNIFLKFRLHVADLDLNAVQAEMSTYGWEIKAINKGLIDICIRPRCRFKDVGQLCAIHIEIDSDRHNCCHLFRVYLKLSMNSAPLKAAQQIFRRSSVWSSLIESDDIFKRTEDRPLVSDITIAYLDVNPGGGFGERLVAYGYEFQVTCRRNSAKLDQITLDYTAASGLDAAIDRINGTLYPASGRLIDKWPPTEIGTPAGEEIIAPGKARLFRFQGASFAQEK